MGQNMAVDLDGHQNLNNWSVGHAPLLKQISSKSVHNLMRYAAKDQPMPYPSMAENPGKRPRIDKIIQTAAKI